jgi:cob(I)alamin adenosyltransferase
LGFTHVYTGDGKGKTTAAIGLLLRALGSGMSVYFGQFFKSGKQSEINTLNKLKKILNQNQVLTVKQFGSRKFYDDKLDHRDILEAIEGFEDIKKALYSGLYDVVIADELNVVIHLGIIDEAQILEVIEKNIGSEFILTGRCAKKSVIEKANLVSEIIKIKHYCDDGLIPRLGIEK